jgi:hypothetical protein
MIFSNASDTYVHTYLRDSTKTVTFALALWSSEGREIESRQGVGLKHFKESLYVAFGKNGR